MTTQKTIRQSFWGWYKKTKALRMGLLAAPTMLRYSMDMEIAYRAGFRAAQARYLAQERT